MRFRRTLLASLAPLIGLSALLAAMSAEPQVSGGSRPLTRLLQSVVQLVTPANEFSVAAPSPERPSAHALLAFAALAATPFRHSLWMIARRPSVNFGFRRHQRLLLRC
ncbi:MAG TPA: hypothetical protein VGG72_11480 [Bryobacteraceae bacterium]